MTAIAFDAVCPICSQPKVFAAPDDYWSCRSSLTSKTCPLRGCITRERALAKVLFSCYSREELFRLDIHEIAPAARGLSLLLRRQATGLVQSGYFPGRPFGVSAHGLRNENMQEQTFPDERFDLVIHMDVLEHLYDPMKALGEVFRTLRPGGRCVFAVPTYWDRPASEQVAFLEDSGSVRIVGEPEYHGNPQDPDGGSLVTWRYGYDLPLLITRHTNFDVEVRRWQSKRDAILGPMTEVYILSRNA